MIIEGLNEHTIQQVRLE